MSDSGKLMTRDNLMSQLEASWGEFMDFIEAQTEEQLTLPTDDAGWTAKDHIIHVAAWEEAAIALLNKKSKREALAITPEVWAQDDDPINAVIQKRHQNMPLDEVMQALQQNHERLLQKLDTMSEADLLLPYNYYSAKSTDERAFIELFIWETAYHYREHIPWMQAIVARHN